MPHKHNWIQIGMRPYKDHRGKRMLMILFRCSICGKEKFTKKEQ